MICAISAFLRDSPWTVYGTCVLASSACGILLEASGRRGLERSHHRYCRHLTCAVVGAIVLLNLGAAFAFVVSLTVGLAAPDRILWWPASLQQKGGDFTQAKQDSFTRARQGDHDARSAGPWICFSCHCASPSKSVLSERDAADADSFVCAACDTRRYGVRYVSLRALEPASGLDGREREPLPVRAHLYTFTKADLRDNAFKVQGATAPFSVDVGDSVPRELRPFIGADFSAVRTYGYGACALHAVFGHPNASGELFQPGAREAVCALLGPTLEHAILRCGESLHLHSICTSLWNEFALLALEGRASDEADTFWESLCSTSPDLRQDIIEHVQRQRAQRADEEIAKEALLIGSRSFFSQGLEDALVRPLAVQLGYIPSNENVFSLTRDEVARRELRDPACSDLLRVPYFEDREGTRLVRGSRVAFRADGPATKYVALFDTRAWFDSLRLAFLVTADASAKMDRFLATANEIMGSDDFAQKQAHGLVSQQDLHAALNFTTYATEYNTSAREFPSPADFSSRAWPAYLKAIRRDSFFFSIDELLVICQCAGVKVVVLKHIGTHFEYAGSSLTGDGPHLFVKLRANNRRSVRSHFERVIAAAELNAMKAELPEDCLAQFRL